MVGVAAAAALALAGCGTTGGGSASPSAQPVKTEIGQGEGQLSILGWPGYAEDGSNDPAVDWVTPFEDRDRLQGELQDLRTSDEAVTLMRTGQYDVVSASGDASLRLIAGNDVAPVNIDLMKNYADVYPFLKDQAWNSVDGQLRRAHGWGANLLMYIPDAVTPAPTSWRAVFDKAADHTGKVTAYDSPIYIADAAVYLMAHKPDLGIKNPYALDEDPVPGRRRPAEGAAPAHQRVLVGLLKEIQAFATGDTVVGTTWQVIENIAGAKRDRLETLLPEEGATGWSDTWMIGSESKNQNCAYLWLDYIASPEANAAVAEYFGESPSNPKALRPTADRHCETYHAGDDDYAEQIWYWTTPMAECLDGRTDVQCIDYSEWTKAWTEIKG